MRILIVCLLVLSDLLVMSSIADDWPGWLGPNRSSEWHESRIVDQFPKGGPPVKWRVPVEWGYAGPAVANGKIYVMDYVHESGEVTNSAGTRDALQGSERILCFDAETGEVVWKDEYRRPYKLSYPRGPRCTPTIADGRVLALGAEGNLSCLDAESGDVIWRKDFVQEYGAEVPNWGFSQHPLVDADLVHCIVGGDGQTAIALNRNTGKEVWRALSSKKHVYCPPSIIAGNGRKQLLIWTPDSLNSLDPASGAVNWTTELKPGFGMATAVPRLIGGRLFATGAGRVSALLSASSGTVIWRGTPHTSVGCSISTPVVHNGVIYGNDAESGTLVAARVDDGQRLWQTVKPIDKDNTRGRGERNATVFIVRNGKQYFLFNDSGELILARLSAEAYGEVSRFAVLKPTNFTGNRRVVWSHPAFADGCMFARNDEELVCVNLATQ